MSEPYPGRPTEPGRPDPSWPSSHPGRVEQPWPDQARWNEARSESGRDASSTTATLPAVSGHDPFAQDANRVPSASVPSRPAAPVPAPSSPSTPDEPSSATRAVKAAKSAASSARPRRNRGDAAPRRARLTLRHVNAWSVLKFSCVLAVALFFVWLIVVGVLYGVLDASGVFDRVNDTVRTINGSANAQNVITPGIVFGGAAVIGAVNIVLFIALSTIGSLVYNLCADLVGGIEVTLSERE